MSRGIFAKMVSVPSLRPLDEADSARMSAYLQQVRDDVVPVIVKQVIEREKRAVEARKLFLR
ncbi:hypothetical protein [Burkholderia sp. Ac-20365]|uniref:hypothetical protein n=1 Tax=Burkholderia sp. Ac-20365 TaxID=2703897 RepID=UPI00197B8135|nr:hypothetical protein [Burkholderia sp. Ac-20365]MBN3761113.1 hypothetical protein [Burkholderia sp. Ac-20365]